MRSPEEIKKEIEDVERQIFYEQMADFMNWSAYFKLKERLKELENELSEVEKNGAI